MEARRKGLESVYRKTRKSAVHVRRSGVKASNNCTHANIKALNRGPVYAKECYKSSGIESEDQRKARLNASFGFYSAEVRYDNLDGTKVRIAEPPPT